MGAFGVWGLRLQARKCCLEPRQGEDRFPHSESKGSGRAADIEPLFCGKTYAKLGIRPDGWGKAHCSAVVINPGLAYRNPYGLPRSNRYRASRSVTIVSSFVTNEHSMAESTTRFGFVAFAETWNGRLAMMGFVIGLGTELLTGQGILGQLGLG